MNRALHVDQSSDNEIKPGADRERSENKVREVSAEIEDREENDADRIFNNDRYVWMLLLYNQS